MNIYTLEMIAKHVHRPCRPEGVKSDKNSTTSSLNNQNKYSVQFISAQIREISAIIASLL